MSDSDSQLISPRSLIWVMALGLLLQVVLTLLRATTSYRALELGIDPGALAVFSVSFSVLPVLIGFRMGQIADTRGERLLLMAGAALILLSALGFWWAGGTLAALVVWTVCLGVGQFMSMLGQQSIVSRVTPMPRRDRMLGYYTACVSIGQVISPLLITFAGSEELIPDTGWLFAVAAGFALAMLLASPGVRLPPHVVAGTAGPGAGLVGLLRVPTMLAAMMVSIAVLCGMDVLVVYLPALGTERHIEPGLIGLLMTVRASMAVCSRLGYNFVIARVSRRGVGANCTCVGGGATGFLAGPPPVWGYLRLGAVSGIAMGICLPLVMAWMADITPAGAHSKVVSLRIGGNRLGQMIVPMLVGGIAVTAGAAMVFVAVGLILVISAHTSWEALKRDHDRIE